MKASEEIGDTQSSRPSAKRVEKRECRMDAPKKVWRVNRKPRFTVLDMGEYMAADDGPRETLLRNMKYERLARTLTYRTLYDAVASYLASPTRDRRILER